MSKRRIRIRIKIKIKKTKIEIRRWSSRMLNRGRPLRLALRVERRF